MDFEQEWLQKLVDNLLQEEEQKEERRSQHKIF